MSARENLRVWHEHIKGEFMTKDTDLSLSTMVEDASVITVPTGWGGKGKAALRPLYRDECIPSLLPSWTHTTKNVVATDDCLVEEACSNDLTNSGVTFVASESFHLSDEMEIVVALHFRIQRNHADVRDGRGRSLEFG